MIQFATVNLPHVETPADTQCSSRIDHLAETERLGDEIARLAAHLHAATYRLLVLIREFDEREGWGGGFRSCADWLSWRTGIAPGAEALGRSEEPLFDGLRTVFGAGLGSRLLALVAVAGLVASFHTIIFAYGRQIFSLSRAGYFPRWLSRTHPTRETPHVALIAGAGLGYGVALTIYWLGSEHPVGAVLLNMAVFGAVISYGLQMASYILLRVRLPDIERPYRSPLGIPGAVLALSIAAATCVALFVSDPVYQRVVIGAAVWYVLGLVYFAVWGRHQLVHSPEEAFAMAAEEAARERPSRAG